MSVHPVAAWPQTGSTRRGAFERLRPGLPAWWDWDISAKMRLLSLASAWVIVSFAWAPFWIIAAVAVPRFAASLVQTIWNHQLDRVHPLGPRGLLDWGMFVTALCASISVAAMADGGLELATPVALALVLAPLSVIQLRAVRKSFGVHEAALSNSHIVRLRITGESRTASRAA